MTGHQVETKSSGAACRSLGPRRGQCKTAVGIAGKPLQSVESKAVAVLNSRGGGRSHIAAAVLLGRPCAAGLDETVRARNVVKKLLPHRVRRVRAEYVRHRSGERNRTMQADVGLR